MCSCIFEWVINVSSVSTSPITAILPPWLAARERYCDLGLRNGQRDRCWQPLAFPQIRRLMASSNDESIDSANDSSADATVNPSKVGTARTRCRC